MKSVLLVLDRFCYPPVAGTQVQYINLIDLLIEQNICIEIAYSNRPDHPHDDQLFRSIYSKKVKRLCRFDELPNYYLQFLVNLLASICKHSWLSRISFRQIEAFINSSNSSFVYISGIPLFWQSIAIDSPRVVYSPVDSYSRRFIRDYFSTKRINMLLAGSIFFVFEYFVSFRRGPIVVVSPEDAKFLMSWTRPSSLFVFPIFLPEPIHFSTLGIKSEIRQILITGNLDEVFIRGGIDLFVTNCLPRIKKSFPFLKFVIHSRTIKKHQVYADRWRREGCEGDWLTLKTSIHF